MARIKRNSQVLLVKHIIRSLCRFVSTHKAIVFMGRSGGALPRDVPKGHCALHVGSECYSFIIPAEYLNHSVFRTLLDKAEEEYGFDHQMGLIIPCEEIAFQYLASMLEKKDLELRNIELDKLTDFHSSTFCYASAD